MSTWMQNGTPRDREPTNTFYKFYVYMYDIATDKAFFHPKNADIFLISQQKHMLWVLIRSASVRRFKWVPTTYVFIEK